MIRYRAFTKRYGDHPAVSDLTLEVPPGAVVALLGPNGSGKTTTIKAAAGLIRPSAGTVLIGTEGIAAAEKAAARLCSFLPQRVAFPDALTGREVVEFYRRLRRAPVTSTQRALEFAALNGAGRRTVGTYSGGMLQRLGLAVAMLPEAPILLLDEPTAALDPDGLSALYGLIDRRRAAGATVFFSSHQLGDVERMADWSAVLAQGRLVAQLSVRDVADRVADRGVMRIRLTRGAAGLAERLREVSSAVALTDDEVIVPGGMATRARALDTVRAAGAEIAGLTVQEGRLEDLYRELIEGRR